MATIGSLVVEFGADLRGLSEGIEEALDLFDDLSERIEQFSEELDALSSKSVVIRATVDTTDIARAKGEIDSIPAGEVKKIEISAGTQQVADAGVAVEDLSTAIDSAGAAATKTQTSLGSVVVRTAAMAAVARESLKSYRDFREGFIKFAAAATSNPVESLRDAFAALRGEMGVVRAVLSGAGAGIQRVVEQFASAERIAGVLQGALGGVLRAFGVVDEAVINAVQSLASYTIGAVAQAASGSIVANSAALLTRGLNASAAAVRRFLDETTAGRAVAAGLASSLSVIEPVALRLNSAIEATASRIGQLLANERLLAAVSEAVTSGFNAVASTLAGLANGSTSLSDVFASLRGGMAAVAARAASLAPSMAQVSRALSTTASIAGRVVSVGATLAGVFGPISAAARVAAQGIKEHAEATEIAGNFFSALARTMASTAVFSAAGGAVTAAAGGATLLGAASAGASAAVGSLTSVFPPVAALAATAAVATGAFAHELEELSLQAQAIGQMASRFGTSTQEMTKLKLAANNTNVSMSQLAKGQQTFYTNLSKIKAGQFNVENVREAKMALDKIGVSVETLKGMKPDEAFKMIAKSVSEVKDPADRTRAAFDLFGKQGAAILPALKEFGELDEDFKRLGGALSDVDFSRYETLETSFDRLKAASASLGQTMLTPFVELQKAFNNASAEIKGGLSAALAPLASMFADLTKPIAAIIEMFGRMVGVALRIVGVFTAIAAYFQVFATLAELVKGIQEGFNAALKPIEDLLSMFSEAGSETGQLSAIFSEAMGYVRGLGEAIGYVIGAMANLLIAVTVGAAAWGIYTAAMALASATSLAAAVSFAIAWAAALGPIALFVGALALLGAGVIAIVVAVREAGKWLYGLGQSLGLISKEREKIDATKASVEEFAEAAAAAAEARAGMSIFPTAEKPAGVDEIKASVDNARSGMADLTIEAARFGEAGAAAASQAQEDFNKLQEQFLDGGMSLEEFDNRAGELTNNLEKNLALLRDDSPAITLKKNLELYKQLDDGVKSFGKSVADLAGGRVVGDKIVLTSDKIKASAKELEERYSAAVEAVKKRQQAGGFQKELTQKREKLEADFSSGRISRDQYRVEKVKLDSTSAQEEAKKAADKVRQEIDQEYEIKIKADMSFADDIRKRLEDSLTTPVQKMQKELQKIQDNKSLSDPEKIAARSMVRQQTRTQLVGQSAQGKLTERTRDLNQAADAGLLGGKELASELKAAMDDFASAVGVTKTPFEEFSSRLDGVAKQFGFAGQPLDEVRKKLAGNAEQLALFDRAVKEGRDGLLQSLGIEKTPQEVFNEQMKKIDEAVNATDPDKRITAEQAEQARDVARRKRDAALGAGEDLGGQFEDREKKIQEAYGGGRDPVREASAMNKLAMDRRQAAGLDATPAQALKAGVDKINDAFGVTGKSMAEIQKELSPSEFAEYQEAIKQNADRAKASLGVEKTGAEKLAESRKKLDKAVADGVITQAEANKAAKKQRDSFLSSLGISKTPAQDFEDAVQKIRENAAELKPDEIARGLKEAKDKLLSSLGIDKSPLGQATDQMDKLTEAFAKGQISAEEFARGMQKTRDTMLQSLGIPLDPITQLAEKMRNLDEALAAGVITNEEFARGQEEAKKALLPGGEEESPVKKFQRDMDTLSRAQQQGLISGDEFNQRKMNLQADLQESLKPALDKLAPDRRGVEGSDVRSKAGVDTFFRILRGNDNPSLKAQLEIARNTRLLAEVAREPDAAPVIAQLGR